ncbi:MAG TPA: C45 family peptidase [Candidatus Udaeobacter sp.]|nr:C45 family peptidase [Candidatus Udaeobacter sp.]
MSGVRIVDAAGSPRQIGRAHGEHMRGQIAGAMDRWIEVIERQTLMSGAAYLASFAAATNFRPAMDQWAPQLIDEIAGIAEGARQDFGRMLAYQLMDEEWAYRSSLVRAGTGSIEACTSFGLIRDDGSALLAQNMDLPSHYDGSQVVLRLRPETGPAAMLFTPAGMIGTTGLNERGVGVCVNAMVQLRHASIGVPVGCVLRAMLACDNVDAAADVIKRAPHATAQNYVIGGSGRIYDFEASRDQVQEVKPESGRVMHTNHPLANDDLDPDVSDVDSTTVVRLERLHELLTGRDGVTVERAQHALSDLKAPICVSRGSSWMTLGSVVMELTGDPVLHVAPGPPAMTPYSEIRFT